MKKVMILGLAAALGLSLAADEAFAVKKKRSAYSEAQQKAFFDAALKICRKRYGSRLHEVKVDYGRNQYICYHY